ncbi:MAG: hypothetical protein IJ381_05555 [Clostridia bacterium]|nr:hypothetical protein [Clostridia bacterium]
MKNAIRLTNRTAINLRKAAERIKKVYFILSVALSVCMAVLAVYLGMKRLIAVPLVVALTVALDALLVIRGRGIYLSMLAQAICTEAAAREIRLGASENSRREKAITDLITAKADVEIARREKRETEKREKQKLPPLEKKERKTAAGTPDAQMEKREEKPEQAPAAHRRRRSDGLKLIRSEEAK